LAGERHHVAGNLKDMFPTSPPPTIRSSKHHQRADAAIEGMTVAGS
jgi:hypothetical protein